MKKDLFYNWHKRSLQGHTSEVDIDAIWAAIEPEVDEINVKRKKKRRFFFFMFFLGFGALSIGLLGFLFSDNTVNAEHIITNQNIIETELKQGTQIALSNIEDPLKGTLSSPTIKAALPHTTNISTDTTTSLKYSSPSFKNLKNDDNYRSTRRNSRSNFTPEVRVASVTTSAQVAAFENTYSKLTQLGSSVLEDPKDLVVDSKIENKTRLDLPIPNRLAQNPFIALEEPESSLPASKVELKKKAPFQLSISAYSGIAVVNKKISSKIVGDSDELLILRKGTEKSLELWNNGLKLKLAHKSGLNFSLGIQYARLAENLQYDAIHVEFDSIANQVIGYSNNLFGDRSSIYGFSPDNTEYDLEYDFYNYYHFVELPLSLGYQKQFRSWNFGIRSTYVHNLSLNTKGRILDSPFEVTDLASDIDTPISNKIKGSFEGGLNVGYRIGSNLEIGLEGFYRHMPSSITKDNYSLDQKYSWGGLNASMNYIF